MLRRLFCTTSCIWRVWGLVSWLFNCTADFCMEPTWGLSFLAHTYVHIRSTKTTYADFNWYMKCENRLCTVWERCHSDKSVGVLTGTLPERSELYSFVFRRNCATDCSPNNCSIFSNVARTKKNFEARIDRKESRLHIRVLKTRYGNLLRSAMTLALIVAEMLMKVLYLWSSVTLCLECCVPLHMGHLLWLLSLNRRSTQLRQTGCWHGNTLGTLLPYFSRQIGHDVSSSSASVSVTFTTGVDTVLVAMTIDWRIHNLFF